MSVATCHLSGRSSILQKRLEANQQGHEWRPPATMGAARTSTHVVGHLRVDVRQGFSFLNHNNMVVLMLGRVLESPLQGFLYSPFLSHASDNTLYPFVLDVQGSASNQGFL